VFQGKFEHTLDDKGRMAVPSPFRRRLGDEDSEAGATVVVTISDQCLAAYPLEEWAKKVEIIGKLNQLNPDVMAFKRFFIGSAQECPVDKGGRILLSADLRRHAGLEKDCMVVGQLDKFEIWSTERWNKTFAQLSDQVATIYGSMAGFGISL
jgi:MraZ protein